MPTQGQDIGKWGVCSWVVGMGTVVVPFNWPWNNFPGLLGTSLIPWLWGCGLILPLFEHGDSLQAGFESSVWIFDFICFQENILSFTGTSWSTAPSEVSTIWNIVQYQNQRNSHLIVKVHDCEWVWVDGFLEGQAAWKIGLAFDPFDSLAVVRRHNFWHWPWLTWNRSQIVSNRIKPRIIPTLKYFWRFVW